MRMDNGSSMKLFHGVCPVCGTTGLMISDAEDSGGLTCPACEWDSSIPVGESTPDSEQDARKLRPVG